MIPFLSPRPSQPGKELGWTAWLDRGLFAQGPWPPRREAREMAKGFERQACEAREKVAVGGDPEGRDKGGGRGGGRAGIRLTSLGDALTRLFLSRLGPRRLHPSPPLCSRTPPSHTSSAVLS